jgi:hypothetical protein
MAQYQIPEQFLLGFKQISLLSNQEVQNIANALQKLPVGTGPITMIKEISQAVQIQKIELIVQTIFSLGNLLAGKKSNPEGLAAGLSEAYFNSLESESKFDSIKDDIKSKLLIILSSGSSLRISFKAFNLLTCNERLYRDGRFVSDIRLIFNDDLTAKERNAVIIHNLKIEHQVDHELQEIYFTLDSKDLHKLKDQIERALEKEKQIKESYSADMNFIEITE